MHPIKTNPFLKCRTNCSPTVMSHEASVSTNISFGGSLGGPSTTVDSPEKDSGVYPALLFGVPQTPFKSARDEPVTANVFQTCCSLFSGEVASRMFESRVGWTARGTELRQSANRSRINFATSPLERPRIST